MLSKSSFVRVSAGQPGVTCPLVTSLVWKRTVSPGSISSAGGSELSHLVWKVPSSIQCSFAMTILPPNDARNAAGQRPRCARPPPPGLATGWRREPNDQQCAGDRPPHDDEASTLPISGVPHPLP